MHYPTTPFLMIDAEDWAGKHVKGWEKNGRGQLKPIVCNLQQSMDPTR